MSINDLKSFSKKRILRESENISYCDMEVYINHLDKLREDFKIRSEDLDNMHVPEWLVTPFEMKTDNKGSESDLEDDLSEMHVDHEAKALVKSKDLCEYWSKVNNVTKYPKLRAAAEPFLL